MLKKCEFDGVEFEAKRATAKFCSTNCRVKAAQRINVDPDTGEVKIPEHPMPSIKPAKDPNPFAASNRDPNYDAEGALAAFHNSHFEA